jgi:ribosomal protein S18 acetylase RimI-like enzyme
MEVVELEYDDCARAVELWTEVGLTRPWNNPVDDFRRAFDGATSTVLGIRVNHELIGTVMVGSDGHRGWVYYLAVGSDHQRVGFGTTLMKSAEEWLRKLGGVKVQLMVRIENESALRFYERLSYETSDVRVLSKWIED